MKRHLTYIALALLLCTACSKERPVQLPQGAQQEVIQFGIESLGRAPYNTAKDILSLGLFGYSTGTETYSPANAQHLPNLFYNQEVSRTRSIIAQDTTMGAWTYSPWVLWPADGSINNTFFAYAPHISQFPVGVERSVSERTASGYPTLRYTVPDVVADQTDILCAVPVRNTNKAGTPNGAGAVQYRMKHTLTWLVFIAVPTQRTKSDGSPIPGDDMFKVTSLRFILDNLVTRAELDLNTGLWSALETGSADYEFNVIENPLKAGNLSVITAAGNRLMLIPQALTRANNKSSIDVTFTISNTEDGDDDNDDDEYFYSIPFPDTKLHEGQVTMYLLKLAADGVEVSMAGQNKIEDWVDGLKGGPNDGGMDLPVY